MQKRLLIGGVILLLLGGGVFLFLQLSSKPAELQPLDFDMIQVQLDDGEYAAARDKLLQFVARAPEDAEAHFLLGLTYFNLNQSDEARSSFMRSLELEPERAAAVYHNLGVLDYQVGNLEDAIQSFERALEHDANDADTHYQLGAAYLVTAFPIGALEPDPEFLALSESEFQLALELDPQKPEALVGLGNIYLFLKQYDDAIGSLEQAIAAEPDMREALFALGQAYATNGQSDLAKETLERFLETDPPMDWARQAEEILLQLGP